MLFQKRAVRTKLDIYVFIRHVTIKFIITMYHCEIIIMNILGYSFLSEYTYS
jgi:hypothetical protein